MTHSLGEYEQVTYHEKLIQGPVRCIVSCRGLLESLRRPLLRQPLSLSAAFSSANRSFSSSSRWVFCRSFSRASCNPTPLVSIVIFDERKEEWKSPYG